MIYTIKKLVTMKQNGLKIKGTQSEMLTITRGSITSCRKNLARFAAYSTLYDDKQQFVEALGCVL